MGAYSAAVAGFWFRGRWATIRYRWIVVVVVVVVAVWVTLCALSLLRATSQLRSGVAAITRVRDEVSPQDLADDRASGDLRTAVDHFASARRSLGAPWIAPLEVVPYVGRQLRSARALAAAADTVGQAGSRTVTEAHVLLDAPHGTPAQRAGLIRQLSGTITDLSRRTSHIDLGPPDALLRPLATKRATFAQELTRLRTALDRGGAATAALSDLLTGPRTYLILAGNNAEMRDGSGMFLEAGTMTANQGTLTFGSFMPTGGLYNPEPTVPLSGDLQRLWGSLQPNQEWRNLALSPQFPANAGLAAQMWQTQMGQRVDGVLAVDIDGLKAILAATGPVTGGGRTVDADNVEQTLLKEQYVGLSSDAAANDPRHEALGELAGAVLGAVQQPGVPFAPLATSVARAAGGRHFLAWAADPTIEADWTAASVSGEVPRDGLLLGSNNRGANKLDPYQHVTARLDTVPAGADTRVRVAVTIANQTPSGLSSYAAAGSDPSRQPGTYVGIVALDFPKASGAARVDRPGVVASGSDYASDVIAVPVTLNPGQSTTVTWTFLLAGHHGRLSVRPSARIPATTWRVKGQRSFTDADAHTVSF
ncbi:MAG: DUF4012 domain-containing protein [Actinomycetota bacterium]|nr:DUF4012 domain-containing protein [Actinomycetota bacterium]